VQTVVRELTETTGKQIAEEFVVLEKPALATLSEEGARPEQITLRRFLDMRYRGQEYTLPVPVMEDLLAIDDFGIIRARFDQLHQEHYGHSAPKEPVVIVNLRLSALGKVDHRMPLTSPGRAEDRGQRGQRQVIFDRAKKAVSSPIYLRSGFKPGDRLKGPAVIEDQGATILLYPDDTLAVNEYGHLLIDLAG